MTRREQQVLVLIRRDPMISQQAIAAKLGISRSAVAGHVMRLTAKGIIKGRGYVVSEQPFVAVAGGANVDIHGTPSAPLRHRDSNPGTVQTSPGGVARNIAENLARLGVDVRLVSVVGDDTHGQLLVQHGRDAGIDMRHVLQLESKRTSTYLSVLDDSGDMQVGISDMSIVEHLGADRLRKLESMFRQSAMLIVDTNLSDEALAYLTGIIADTPVFVDTVSTAKATRIRPYLHRVHTLKPSLIEAEVIAGMEARNDKQLSRMATWFHRQGVQRLFVSLGGRGVFYSTQKAQGIEKYSGKEGSLRNAAGAGDALLAGLAYAWLKRWPLKRSLQFGLSAASITLAHADSSSPALSLAALSPGSQG